MRSIVRYILFILAFLLLVQCEKEEPEPEPEPLEEFRIVDGSFINALAANGFDKNNDRFIDSVEALAIEYLNVDSCNIFSLSGIQNFVNLKELSCQYNNIRILDISYNSKLGKLYCNNNQLSELTVENNIMLFCMYCNDNQLSSLNVTEAKNLRKLHCENNSMSNLDISDNYALNEIDCSGNQLLKLEVNIIHITLSPALSRRCPSSSYGLQSLCSVP